MAKEYYWESNDEIILNLANRFTKIRKRKNITQKRLSDISGVSYASIKRFEQSGDISLYSLTKLCSAMNLQEELNNMFSDVEYKSIQEIKNGNKIY